MVSMDVTGAADDITPPEKNDLIFYA